MDAINLLAALQSTIPGCNIHLRLSPDGALVIGICDTSVRQFYDARLDADDLTREPSDIAAEVGALFVAYKAATPAAQPS